MELNSILFPAPIEDKKLELPKLKDKLIFIPKQEQDGSTFHIPCYYRATRKRTDSNKFFFYFHGNAEDMRSSHLTSHTTNPVPMIVVNGSMKLKKGGLADVAPTILKVMKLQKPKEMTGKSLF